MKVNFGYIETIASVPLGGLLLFSLIVIFAGLFNFRLLFLSSAFWAFASCVFTVILAISFWSFKTTAFQGMLAVDKFSFLGIALIMFSTALIILGFAWNKTSDRISSKSIGEDKSLVKGMQNNYDLLGLVLFASLAGIILVCARNLALIFLSIEFLSITLYALAASDKSNKHGAESALKYFLIGAFFSAILLYSMALIYGKTGSLDLQVISAHLQEKEVSKIFLISLVLFTFSLLFKLGQVPFHFWVADVYEGSPTFVTTFMAVIVKIAVLFLLARILVLTGISGLFKWQGIIWFIGILSMCVGNLLAMRQRNFKRLLAFSSIANVGYILGALLSLNYELAIKSTIFYLLAYALVTITIFTVIGILEQSKLLSPRDNKNGNKNITSVSIEDFRGLYYKKPLLAIATTLALLSLAGFPPLVGFLGKFYLLRVTLEAGYLGFSVFLVINTLVSFYTYLRIVSLMFSKVDENSDNDNYSGSLAIVSSSTARLGLLILSILTLGLGIYPQAVLEFCQAAVKNIL